MDQERAEQVPGGLEGRDGDEPAIDDTQDG
jgi:hypothetical protein